MIYAALDIGGTKTIAALTDENGTILTQKKFPSYTASSQTHLDICADALGELMGELGLEAKEIHGLGISLPGIVDSNQGILLYAPYAKWENVPVAEYLGKKLGIASIRCENDVNACAIGELKFGLGKKYSDFVWMTVSTGVGGASVSGGRLLRGADGFAGELGHLKVEYDHPAQCPCGQMGCLEAQGSGTALNRLTAQAAQQDREFAAALTQAGVKADGAGCAKLAQAGNPRALAIFDEIGTYLGRGMAYCVNVLNPQAVVVGGGVSASLELLRPAITAALKANAFHKMQNIDVVCTPLGYEAALIGAAALAAESQTTGGDTL